LPHFANLAISEALVDFFVRPNLPLANWGGAKKIRPIKKGPTLTFKILKTK
jgi:hypothetical protein